MSSTFTLRVLASTISACSICLKTGERTVKIKEWHCMLSSPHSIVMSARSPETRTSSKSPLSVFAKDGSVDGFVDIPDDTFIQSFIVIEPFTFHLSTSHCLQA